MPNEMSPPPLPTWWRPDHQTTWDRVQEAFKRDWEQTKADLSGGRSGTDLNQQVGDTLRQATGTDRIPPIDVANPLTPRQTQAKVAHATKEMAHSAERIAEEAERSAAVQEREGRPGREENWDHAVAPLRYGYAAAGHYTGGWDDMLERTLRTEWAELHPEDSWEDVRDAVHDGWTRARAPDMPVEDRY